MISPRSSFIRLLAALMPVYFIWLFVACAVLCSEHCGETSEVSVVCLSDEVCASHNEACCRITAAQKSILPERAASVVQVNGNQESLLVSPSQMASDALSAYGHISIPISAPDPPFERLCTLRI